MTKPHGINVRRLIIEKTSKDAIKPGGGVADGIAFLKNPEAIKAGMVAAEQWVELAILAVREAAEPNPWKTADDEAIAGEILRQIEEKKRPWMKKGQP